MDQPPPIYRPSPSAVTEALRQGEIVCDLHEFRLEVATIGTEEAKAHHRHHPYAIIISQDCDLEQDYKARQGTNASDKFIPGILFCEVATAVEIRGADWMNGGLWKPVPQNKNERYHFLQKIEVTCDAVGCGMDELVIDFKRYFTIPTEEVYLRIQRGEAKRRCVLASPYLEHFSSRFAYYLSRVALPFNHASE